jgi:phospholipid/cholesterol/gamma-HCH transport system substrate-binding protein
MGHNIFETILGAVVLALGGLFMVFAYSSADLNKVKGYTITANFPMVDGIKDGTDVKMNGVKIGSVQKLNLNTEPGSNQFLVTVTMTIESKIQLPTDSIALVSSESLLGGKYMSLEPGVDETIIKTDGTGRVTHTQAPMRLDDLIGQLIYSNKRGESSASSAAETTQPPAAVPVPVSVPVPAPAPASSPAHAPVPAPAPAPASEPAHP